MGKPDSTSRDAPIVVVGGGPAGACAALHLARGGARVVLLEKATPPRPKVCGGGVVARAWRELPADVRLPVRSAARRIELLDHAGRTHVVERATPIVSLVLRDEFDHALLDAARSAGADVRTGCRLLGVRALAAQDELVLDTSAGELRASLLLAADGAHSDVARHAGFAAAAKGTPALEAEVRGAARGRADAVVFDFQHAPHGYAWSFGKPGQISAGVLTRRGEPSPRALLPAILAAHGLDEAAHCDVAGQIIPARPRRTLAKGRILLLGDAAGLADPLTYEGISLALRSARLAAQAALSHGPHAARAYERALSGDLLPELRRARLLAHVVYEHPRLAHAIFATAGQALCEAMVAIICGERSYASFLRSPRAWWRLAGSLRARPR